MMLWTVFLVLGVTFFPGECRKPTHPGVSVHLSHRDRKMNVQYFNDLRRDVGAADMNELTWDLSMAKEARRQGRSCDFREDPYDEYSSALYKQLFDPTARPGEIIMNAIRFWAAQKFNFTRYGWRSCKKRNTCNYIKMITASTEKAACSLTRCSSMRNQREDEEANMYFVTCLFSPGLGTTGAPFSTGRKCSRCPLYSGCRRGLCSLSGRRYKNAIRPPLNKNRIVPLLTKDDTSKGRILSDHRYLDASGNIRIRTQPKYLAQKGRGPTYIHRPPPGTVQHRRDQAAGDSRRNAAARGIPPQSARVRRQADSYDYRYQLMLRRREEQRRREEERKRREKEQQERWAAQQLRQRGTETRINEDLERRHIEAQRRRIEQLRRQREEEQRQQRELQRRRIEEERRRRERQREQSRQGRQRQEYGPARLESPGMNSTQKFQLTQVHNTLRGTQLAELSWSGHLERWARYVVRCEIQYPGPIDTFTNFGKIDMTSLVYNIVYDWGAEGSDVAQRLNKGCRTPDDRESCNHNVIIRNPFIRSFACATLDCGREQQLTCIYK